MTSYTTEANGYFDSHGHWRAKPKTSTQTTIFDTHGHTRQIAHDPEPQTLADPPRQRRVGRVDICGDIADDMANDIVKHIHSLGTLDQIDVVIDSRGGVVTAKDRIIDAIKSDPNRWVTTHCIGHAGSAAFEIFIVGDERLMTVNSSLQTHNATCGGDDTAANVVAISDETARKISRVAFNVDFSMAREWMHRDTSFDAREAIGLGIATGYSPMAQRTFVDGHSLNHVSPPEDYRATKDFQTKLAKKPPAPSPIPRKTRPNPIKRSVRDIQDPPRSQAELEAIGCVFLPEMPASLRGKCFAQASDIHDIVAVHNSHVVAGVTNPFAEYQARQSQRFLELVQRAQAQGMCSKRLS